MENVVVPKVLATKGGRVSVYRRSPLTVIRGHLTVGWREVYAMVRADGNVIDWVIVGRPMSCVPGYPYCRLSNDTQSLY